MPRFTICLMTPTGIFDVPGDDTILTCALVRLAKLIFSRRKSTEKHYVLLIHAHTSAVRLLLLLLAMIAKMSSGLLTSTCVKPFTITPRCRSSSIVRPAPMPPAPSPPLPPARRGEIFRSPFLGDKFLVGDFVPSGRSDRPVLRGEGLPSPVAIRGDRRDGDRRERREGERRGDEEAAAGSFAATSAAVPDGASKSNSLSL